MVIQRTQVGRLSLQALDHKAANHVLSTSRRWAPLQVANHKHRWTTPLKLCRRREGSPDTWI